MPDLSEAAILRLVGQSWREYVALGVTGRLRRSGDVLEQLIEGPRGILLPLVARILCDPRHRSIEIIAFGPIDARACAEWRVDGCREAGSPAHGTPVGPGNVVTLLRAQTAEAGRAARLVLACGT